MLGLTVGIPVGVGWAVVGSAEGLAVEAETASLPGITGVVCEKASMMSVSTVAIASVARTVGTILIGAGQVRGLAGADSAPAERVQTGSFSTAKKITTAPRMASR